MCEGEDTVWWLCKSTVRQREREERHFVAVIFYSFALFCPRRMRSNRQAVNETRKIRGRNRELLEDTDWWSGVSLMCKKMTASSDLKFVLSHNEDKKPPDRMKSNSQPAD